MNKAGDGKMNKKRMLVCLAVLLLAAILLSLCIGRYQVGLSQVVRILIHEMLSGCSGGRLHLDQTWTRPMATAILQIRLPRVLLAALVGMALAVAGAAFQGVFQNPMASPDILGASSGAGFGAALAILLGASQAGITAGAFACSLVTIALVFLVASRARGIPVVSLILAGMMVSTLFSAGIGFIKLVADPNNQLPAITYWLMGSLSGAKSTVVRSALLPMGMGMAELFLFRWRLNLLSLGEEEAKALGVQTVRLRAAVIFFATLLTASAISVSGMIGWVGLVIPHMARKLVGNDYRYLFPASLLTGGIFLLLVDDVARNLLEAEIPIGILTAFVGAPFFLYLICRKEP